jgi:PPOX class probable F420-dependent enzyme
LPDSTFADLASEKYISLETFRRSGQGVATPVWFVLDRDRVYVYTVADSGKVKRIGNNPRVRVAACGVRGALKGPWFDGVGAFVEGDERVRANRLLDRKYLLKRLGNLFFWAKRRERTMIRIDPPPERTL